MNDRWKRAALVLIAVLIVWNSFYVMPETETGIVTLFGKPVRTVLHAGLYLKWPIQRLLRFEKRLLVYNPRPSEFLTRDKKNLVLDSDVIWRISDPNRFLQTVGDVVTAEMRLHDIVWAALAAELGNLKLEDLVSVEPSRIKTAEVTQAVRRKVSGDQFGIQVMDVQLKRLTFPEQNKKSVFARMRAERETNRQAVPGRG